MLMQLAAGSFKDIESWANLIVHQRNLKIARSDDLEGSDGCGNGCPLEGAHADNGACTNIFCMVWESHGNNTYRNVCHRLFGRTITNLATDSSTADNALCVCFPGGTLACILGRAHKSHDDVKTAFFKRFDSIRREVNHEGRGTNRFGRCPFCQKEVLHITKLNSLSDHTQMNNVNLCVRHMNLVQSTKMEELVNREF